MAKLKAKDPTAAIPSKPKIIIYGASGVGKTWAALDFPNAYYIDTEGGANLEHYTKKLKKSGGMYFGVEDGSKDFFEVIEQVKALATTKHQYKTLVIDSGSELMLLYIAAQSEKMMAGGADMTKTYGAEKKPAVSYARQLVNWIQRLDMTVLLICHEKGEWKDEKQVGMTFDFWEKAEYILHLVLRVVKIGGSRKAFVRKSRLEQFPDAENFDWSYENFAKLYGKDIIEAESTPIKLASTEQIAEVRHLLETVKLNESTKDKWIADNQNDLQDLEFDKVDGMIKHLKDKITPKIQD